MSEYIERGALMDKIGERLAYLREKNGNYDPYTDGYEECYCEVEEAPAADVVPVKHGTREKNYNFVLTVIEGAPTVDAAEVVRCKDCKHFDPDSSVCKYSGWLMDGGSDFCSRGIDKDFFGRR